MQTMKRKIEWLMRKLAYYTEMLDRATTAKEIGEAKRMKSLYESALLALEERE